MPVSRLKERVADWRQLAEYDQSSRILKNVALSGCESKNGYRYTEQALRKAAALYDQKPVFLDHAEKRTEPGARSTRDLVGSIVNPRFDGGRIRGDVRVLDTDSGRTFLALVEGATPGVGMSHVVLATRSRDGQTVERIEDVISVDVVVRPATTSTFRESEDAPPEREAVELTEVDLQVATSGTQSSGMGSSGDGLPRVIELLERLLAVLEPAGGRATDGRGVQEGTATGREAALLFGGAVQESRRRSRVSSVPRRDVETGCSRAEFVAAIRGS
jgi:hypothetical protein